MIALEVDDEILVERLLGRGKTSGRADDADDAEDPRAARLERPDHEAQLRGQR